MGVNGFEHGKNLNPFSIDEHGVITITDAYRLPLPPTYHIRWYPRRYR